MLTVPTLRTYQDLVPALTIQKNIIIANIHIVLSIQSCSEFLGTDKLVIIIIIKTGFSEINYQPCLDLDHMHPVAAQGTVNMGHFYPKSSKMIYRIHSQKLPFASLIIRILVLAGIIKKLDTLLQVSCNDMILWSILSF